MDTIAVKGSIIRCKNAYCEMNITVLKDTKITYDSTLEEYKLVSVPTSTVYASIPEDEFIGVAGNTRFE